MAAFLAGVAWLVDPIDWCAKCPQCEHSLHLWYGSEPPPGYVAIEEVPRTREQTLQEAD